MSLTVILNGQPRIFDNLPSATTLDVLLMELSLKADRVAVEHNGVIAPRASWLNVGVNSGDKLEVVHFVGGGSTSGSIS